MHRFLISAALLTAGPLRAQLAIPGLLPDPEPVESGEGMFIPAPENNQGLFATTNRVEASGEAERSTPDAQRLIRMMEGANPVFLNQAPVQMESQPWHPLAGAPERVIVFLETASGRSVTGVALNQPLLVQTGIGRMVVRLDEIQELMRKEEGTDRHWMQLRNGDLLRGTIHTPYVDLIQPDGGKHRVPVAGWLRLESTAADP